MTFWGEGGLEATLLDLLVGQHVCDLSICLPLPLRILSIRHVLWVLRIKELHRNSSLVELTL